jgi:hypothetical protein
MVLLTDSCPKLDFWYMVARHFNISSANPKLSAILCSTFLNKRLVCWPKIELFSRETLMGYLT